ncbi:hypothetical protein ACFOSC_33005 [Streptantibioticus rubrisoli]|uniref:Uncharacterized protein n=1 Tax=Streptantibioticus rubrisoli TaxID=1387313 RepID=A0ABT1PHA6_9ACTN|nr:hypothetical protein [Streptantibioticus rubrisoli]MCQ4044752.1 hypothetical protein [Streptantibioticus rubrisoli]
MSSLLPEPVPSAGCGLSASVRAAITAVDLSGLLVLVVILTTLIVLLARGMSLDEALAVLGAGGALAGKLRKRLT